MREQTQRPADRKKIITIVIIAAVLAAIVVGAVVGGLAAARKGSDEGYDSNIKNVILMIGDGMGPEHVEAGRAYAGEGGLFMENEAVFRGEVTTNSLTSGGPTDSAAAATALSTGHKTDNGAVAQYRGQDLKTNMEYAAERGLATGVIASEGVKGATPAAFSSHAADRDDVVTITEGQIASGIDLFLGGAASSYAVFRDRIAAGGYTYAGSTDELDPAADKLWGAFEELYTDEEGTADSPTLAELSLFAIDFLSQKSDEGFFLVIEESHIDKCSHSNDMNGMLRHLKAYDEAIKAVVTAARETEDTLVIATADHETGGLVYDGETADELGDDMFTTGSHTETNVPYFVYTDIPEAAPVIDNTEIALICRAYILRQKHPAA